MQPWPHWATNWRLCGADMIQLCRGGSIISGQGHRLHVGSHQLRHCRGSTVKHAAAVSHSPTLQALTPAPKRASPPITALPLLLNALFPSTTDTSPPATAQALQSTQSNFHHLLPVRLRVSASAGGMWKQRVCQIVCICVCVGVGFLPLLNHVYKGRVADTDLILVLLSHTKRREMRKSPQRSMKRASVRGARRGGKWLDMSKLLWTALGWRWRGGGYREGGREEQGEGVKKESRVRESLQKRRSYKKNDNNSVHTQEKQWPNHRNSRSLSWSLHHGRITLLSPAVGVVTWLASCSSARGPFLCSTGSKPLQEITSKLIKLFSFMCTSFTKTLQICCLIWKRGFLGKRATMNAWCCVSRVRQMEGCVGECERSHHTLVLSLSMDSHMLYMSSQHSIQATLHMNKWKYIKCMSRHFIYKCQYNRDHASYRDQPLKPFITAATMILCHNTFFFHQEWFHITNYKYSSWLCLSPLMQQLDKLLGL